MNIMPVLHAAAFAICGYAGLLHLLIGLRRKPTDRIHIIFALLCLAHAFRNFCELLFHPAAADGRMADYVFWSTLGLWGYLLGHLFLIWFVAFYTRLKSRSIPIALCIPVLVLLWVQQISPIHFHVSEITGFSDYTLPWGEIVTYPDVVLTHWIKFESGLLFAMIACFIYAAVRQYLRGEHREALLIGIGVSIFLVSVLNDVLIDH